MKPIALIVDDTEANRIFFERLITQAGFDVRATGTGHAALTVVTSQQTPALAIVDMQIPDMSGLELTARLRDMCPNVCIVVATMHDEPSLIESAFQRGCDVFLVKPHGFMDLFKRLTTQGTASLRAEAPLIIDQYGWRQFRPAGV